MRIDSSLPCNDDFHNRAKVVEIIEQTHKFSFITISETFFGGEMIWIAVYLKCLKNIFSLVLQDFERRIWEKIMKTLQSALFSCWQLWFHEKNCLIFYEEKTCEIALRHKRTGKYPGSFHEFLTKLWKAHFEDGNGFLWALWTSILSISIKRKLNFWGRNVSKGHYNVFENTVYFSFFKNYSLFFDIERHLKIF